MNWSGFLLIIVILPPLCNLNLNLAENMNGGAGDDVAEDGWVWLLRCPWTTFHVIPPVLKHRAPYSCFFFNPDRILPCDIIFFFLTKYFHSVQIYPQMTLGS